MNHNILHICSINTNGLQQSEKRQRLIEWSKQQQCIVTVCGFVRHLFSWYPFYFDFHSARIIFYVSSGFYLWNINNTKADICKK